MSSVCEHVINVCEIVSSDMLWVMVAPLHTINDGDVYNVT